MLFYNRVGNRGLHVRLTDLSGDEGRILQLRHAEKVITRSKRYHMGFLPSGDLILISLFDQLKDCKIYLYSFPTMEYSQTYDIKFHKSLNKHNHMGNCLIYRTKLFLFNEGYLTQWDLLTLTFEMHYHLTSTEYLDSIVINENQTLLASCFRFDEEGKVQIDIYSMKIGRHISRYG